MRAVWSDFLCEQALMTYKFFMLALFANLIISPWYYHDLDQAVF